jgi:hypothetical protein
MSILACFNYFIVIVRATLLQAYFFSFVHPSGQFFVAFERVHVEQRQVVNLQRQASVKDVH